MDQMTGKTCLRCGYELTGLDQQGRCPECGGYFNDMTGEGIAGGPMEKHRRGDLAVDIFHVGCLLMVALAIFVFMLWLLLEDKGLSAVLLAGFMGVLFILTALVKAHSMKAR